jgi:xylanolytic transcriptional activator XlnR
MDRHLALCFNRSTTLLDTECARLLQPMHEDKWQSSNFSNIDHPRITPSFECTGYSVFGFFLPLITILGEILELNHFRHQPHFDLYLQRWDILRLEWRKLLDALTYTLKVYMG